MARQNYRHSKQQRERAKKIKRDKKELRRAERANPRGVGEPATEGAADAPQADVADTTVQDGPATADE